jgi:hypothetical protein
MKNQSNIYLIFVMRHYFKNKHLGGGMAQVKYLPRKHEVSSNLRTPHPSTLTGNLFLKNSTANK